MPLEEDQYFKELITLRQGRALASIEISRRLGPALRMLCGIEETDDDAVMTRKAVKALKELAESLPRDQHAAALVALGLHGDFDQPRYGQRIHAATGLFDREERTVRRRVDESFRQLARRAAQATADHRPQPPGVRRDYRWRTEALCAAMSLASPTAEAFERRTIVAMVDGLSELDLAISVPSDSVTDAEAPARAMTIDVFQGGTLVERAMESTDRVGLVLRLPRPLAAGERRDICLRYRTRLHYPHYACTPRYPCDSFNVSVRFGAQRPSAAFLLAAGFQEDARDTLSPGAEVLIDSAGEIHAAFNDLLPGFTYGLRWSWP